MLGRVTHLLVNVWRQVTHIEICGVGVSVVEGACAVVLQLDALLPPQPLPFLARLLLPSQPPSASTASLSVPRAQGRLGDQLLCCPLAVQMSKSSTNPRQDVQTPQKQMNILLLLHQLEVFTAAGYYVSSSPPDICAPTLH